MNKLSDKYKFRSRWLKKTKIRTEISGSYGRTRCLCRACRKRGRHHGIVKGRYSNSLSSAFPWQSGRCPITSGRCPIRKLSTLVR